MWATRPSWNLKTQSRWRVGQRACRPSATGLAEGDHGVTGGADLHGSHMQLMPVLLDIREVTAHAVVAAVGMTVVQNRSRHRLKDDVRAKQPQRGFDVTTVEGVEQALGDRLSGIGIHACCPYPVRASVKRGRLVCAGSGTHWLPAQVDRHDRSAADSSVGWRSRMDPAADGSGRSRWEQGWLASAQISLPLRSFRCARSGSTAGRRGRSRHRLEWSARADVAQLARASACHAEGRGFESLHPLSVICRDVGDR